MIDVPQSVAARSHTVLRLATAWLVVALVTPHTVHSEEAVYETPEAAAADADFAVQGEYVGERLGVQVVALGKGEFHVVTYTSGLPGAGWDGQPPQVQDADREEAAELLEGLKKTERVSTTLGAKPPKGAVVLFDGTRESLTTHWVPGARATDDGLLAQGCTSIDTFDDFHLHLEFCLPYMPLARGQGRGNSGVYFQGRYESQILDSFGLEGTDHECGGFYDIAAPAVNMCLPPLAWQTYDVEFTSARWHHQGEKTANARITVRLNGVSIHQEVEISAATLAAPQAEAAGPGPIYLQEHGSPVRYRNIWVVRRDAAREARRPIVPAFERFYTVDYARQVAGGRFLLGELNCTACHAADAVLAAQLVPRPAPVLAGVGGRIKPDYLLRFIADPHGTKPGTTMPDVLAGLPPDERGAASRAIVNFLATTSNLREQAGNQRFAANGEKLFDEIGCVACHAPRKGASDQYGDGLVPLIALDEKYTIPALAEFLREPHQFRPAGRMPSLNLNPDEARDLACFLVGDVNVRPRAPTLRYAAYQGSWDRLPAFSALAPVGTGESAGLDLNVAGRTGNFGVRFEGFLPIDREGEYTFHLGSDDGSVLSIDETNVVDNDGMHPHQVRTGTVALKQGAHSIRVDYMQGGGEWTLELEIEGPGVARQPADLLCRLTEAPPRSTPKPPDDDTAFVFDAAQVEKGRELFASLGCTICHAMKKDETVANASAKPLADCDPTKGCLADVVTRPAADFVLGQAQREALAAALVAGPAGKLPEAVERIEQTMTAFNCFACHARGGAGGPTAERNSRFLTSIPEMGDEGRVPPPLDGVGDKLQEGWLRHVLAEGAKVRPYMLTRMPRFGAAAVAKLADDFMVVDLTAPAAGGPVEPAELPHRIKAAGRQLVGDKALACVKCHTFGPHRASGIQALDLLTMTRRIRPGWFARYLLDPLRYRPGTRMPSSFVNGSSTITSVYDGEPGRQIAAIWNYLADGEKAGIPDGLIAELIELKPEHAPIIYRNFIDGLSPRGIAVGYPEKAHLAWDADHFCLSQIWHGRFIDASTHWVGRGAGFQTPLGDDVIKFEQTVPVARLATSEESWPAQPPKERGYRFRGYRLDERGRPTFRYDGPDFQVEDHATPVIAGDLAHFQRRITVHSTVVGEGLYFRAAVGNIRPLDVADRARGGVFLVGGAVTLRLRPDRGAPLVRTSAGRQELLLPMTFENGKAEVVEEIEW
jgi:cytochrome c553